MKPVSGDGLLAEFPVWPAARAGDYFRVRVFRTVKAMRADHAAFAKELRYRGPRAGWLGLTVRWDRRRGNRERGIVWLPRIRGLSLILAHEMVHVAFTIPGVPPQQTTDAEERFCHAVSVLVAQCQAALWREGIRSV